MTLAFWQTLVFIDQACWNLVVTRWVVYTSSNTAFTLWPGLARLGTARNSASFTLWNRASEPKCFRCTACARWLCSLLSMRTILRARGCRTLVTCSARSTARLRSHYARSPCWHGPAWHFKAGWASSRWIAFTLEVTRVNPRWSG